MPKDVIYPQSVYLSYNLGEIINELKANLPCGIVMGHGDSCTPNWLCSGCSIRKTSIVKLQKVMDSLSFSDEISFGPKT